MKKTLAVVTLASAAASAATPALADRPPTPQERAAVEQGLRANGFVSWEEIELDDDGPRWEIDDAVARDGQRYDVELDVRTLRIVRRNLDN